LLEQPHFDSYNRKVADSNVQVQSRIARANKNKTEEELAQTPSKDTDESLQLRDPLDYSTVEDKVEQFKRDIILKTMYDQEGSGDSFALWLNLHDGQTGTEFDYLNTKGVIRKSRGFQDSPFAKLTFAQYLPAQSAIQGKAKQAQSTTQNKTTQSPQRSTQDLPNTKKTETYEDPDDDEAVLAKLNSGREAADLEG
jgi:hypothetical protein